MLRIGIVVGEQSGDALGAGLVRELKKKVDNLHIEGVLGPRLIAEGGNSLFSMDKLSVTGVTEVFSRYLELSHIRNQLKKHFLINPPDVFIGIDSPDFNISLERLLRINNIKTVHYVSPSVWAWRSGRIKDISRATDLLLCLYPFESDYYTNHPVDTEYVGHPLADSIELVPDAKQARKDMGLDDDAMLVAILPGSRINELENHLTVFSEAAKWSCQSRHDLVFAVCFPNQFICDKYSDCLERKLRGVRYAVHIGQSVRVMQAADVVLLASGTATLEAMLLKKPMVVGYRVSALSYILLKHLIKIPFISLPNILSGRKIVPELLQKNMRPELLGQEILDWLDSPHRIDSLKQQFSAIHVILRKQADIKAAAAVMKLCQRS